MTQLLSTSTVLEHLLSLNMVQYNSVTYDTQTFDSPEVIQGVPD